MKKFHYVYVITNLVNNKQYIGDHSTDNLKDDYLGSGKPLFENAKKKYKRENFKKDILEFFDTKQGAFDAQEKYIFKYSTLAPSGYNLSPKGGLRVQGCHSKETIEKIRQSNLGKKRSEKTKKKISESHKCPRQPLSMKTRKKISKSLKGKNIGKVRTDEYKENLRKYASEHKKENNYWKDKKFSEEHKEKLRLAALKRWSN